MVLNWKARWIKFTCLNGIGVLILMFCSNKLNAQRVLPDEVKIDASFANVPIDSALILLSSVSGVNISYNSNLIPPEILRTIEVRNLELGNVLDDILYDTGLIYKIVANQLSIIRNPALIVKPMYTLNGWVSEEGSDERIPLANVFTDDRAYSTQTNEFGYFSMTLPQGVNVLSITSFAYMDRNMTIDIQADTSYMIVLNPLELSEVLITDKLPGKSKKAEQFDQIPLEMISSMSALAGEPDIMRMVQMRAGVNTAADGLGGISIRGGNTDQNLILMDGMPVYNTGHALGLFSIFNHSAVKDVNVIKSGFPARYGGRLSSVMDVVLKEGNKQELKGEVGVNPLLARAVIEGPIKKGASSFIISGRRTIVDPWLKPLSRYSFELDDQEGFIDYKFHDFNAKLNFFLSEKDELYIAGYTGRDQFENDVLGTITDDVLGTTTSELDNIRWDWGNDILSTRWSHYFNRKLVSYVNVGYSNYSFESFNFDRTIIEPNTADERVAYTSTLYQSNIRDYIFNGHVDYFASSNYFLKVGFNYINHRLRPGSTFSSTQDGLLDGDNRLNPDIIEQLIDIDNIDGVERRIYAENEWTLNNVIINGGLHWSHISTDNNSYSKIQPRIATKFLVGERSQIKLAYSQMDQFLHLLSSSGFGLPNDIWIPSTDNIAPQNSTEFSISFSREIPSFGTVSLSLYDRSMSNIRSLSEGGFLSVGLSENWEQELPVGTQDAYGLELEIDKRVGRLRGWVNYTLAKATNTFEGINNGDPFAARLDRRHSIKTNLAYKLNQNLEITTSWQYASGLPYTAPVALTEVEVEGQVVYVPVFSTINNIDLPAFHRLDFSVNLYTDYDWGRQTLSIGAYNTTNNFNPFYVDVIRDSASNSFRSQAVSIVPVFPFVSLSIRF